MEYLRRFVKELRLIIIKKPQSNILEVSRYNAYFNTIYKILLWEDPIMTWIVLAIFHVLFWFIVQFNLRLYGIIFLTLLIGFLTDLYFERIGLQASGTESSNSIRRVLDLSCNAFLYLKVLRRDNPSMFCGLMCIVFLIMSIISKNVPGYLVAYIILIFVFFGPLATSKLPNEYKSNVVNSLLLFNNNEGVLAETELIPFLTNKEMNEKDPELESLLTDRTADSVTSSLMNGINSMPSYLEAEGSLDGLDEEDLVPNVKPSSTIHTPEDNSTDSDSDDKNIKFDSMHYNGDSSSDDEKHYSAGLRFAEVLEVAESLSKLDEKKTQNIALGILSNLRAVGTSIMSNVIGGVNVDKPKRKDSDSDFEFINPEDTNQ